MTTDLKRLSDANIVRVCAYVSVNMSKKADRFVRLRGAVRVWRRWLGQWTIPVFVNDINRAEESTDCVRVYRIVG